MTMIDELNLTSLPLDSFRKIMGVDPWHFWQMSTPVGCSSVYTHYRWIGDNGPGRFDYAQAIQTAEQMLAQKLDYWPGLLYTNNEIVRMIIPRQPVLYNRTPMKLEVRWHHVYQTGLRTWTLITDVNPAYAASEDVTFAVVVPAGTIASEVVVCYAGTTIPIRPISVSISLGVATITIKKWLMGDYTLWSTDDLIDPNDNDNLLDTVSVYRVTYDSQHAILLAWEPEILSCGCLSEDCVVCSGATHVACAMRGDYKNGLISWQASEYDATNSRWVSHAFPSTRFPDIAYVNYLHGVDPAPDLYMSPYWAQIVAHLAVSLMDEADCGCSDVMSSMRYWREDLGFTKDTSHQLGPSDLDNQYGQRRGQLAAWKAVLMHIGD